jgi:hypothetical protein
VCESVCLSEKQPWASIASESTLSSSRAQQREKCPLTHENYSVVSLHEQSLTRK